MDKKLTGRWGESAAADYLKKKKYSVIGMNYSCRFGEIDIIAENRNYIVFAEVKCRRSAAFAEAKEFVTSPKQQRIVTTAQLWLQSNPTEKQPRFDVIEVYGEEGLVRQINHLENAFGGD